MGQIPFLWSISGIDMPFGLWTVELRMNGPDPFPYIGSHVSTGNLGDFSHTSAKVPIPMSIDVG